VATLTPREHAVLAALAETGALDEIAANLYVSRNTVKSQLSTVYRKLGVSSREAALTRAAVLGLLEEPAA
jgi:LuxR family maltose regulon positive regulatory protein